MSDNPFIGDPDFPTKYRKNETQRIAFGYIPSPEDPLVLVPDPEVSPYVKEAFDFIDDGGPFRHAAQWLTEKCGRSISHQGIKRIWQQRRGDPKTNARAKEMQKQAKKRKPKTAADRKKAEIKTKLSQAKRLQTIQQKKLDNWLEKDEWEAQYKAEKEGRSVDDVRAEMQAAKEAAKPVEAAPEPAPAPAPAKPKSSGLPDDVDIVFKPNPGPQTEFLAAPEREVLYGGSAGGGKSYAMLADPMRYFDNKNFAGILFRRTNDELRELIWKSQEIYPRAFPGAKWQEKKSQWVFPSGARLWLTYLERDEDVLRYQGQAFCVASDTPVLMADLSYKAMRDVKEGDEVHTINGPRRITYKSPAQVKRCVKATVYSHDGHPVSQQLHPDTHPTALLSSEPLRQYSDWYQTVEQFRLSRIQWLSAEHLGFGTEETPEDSVSSADDQNGCRAFELNIPAEQQLRGLFYPTVLSSLDPRLSEVRASTRCRTCGKSLRQSSGIDPKSPQLLTGSPPYGEFAQSHLGCSTEHHETSFVHETYAPLDFQTAQDFQCDCHFLHRSHDAQPSQAVEYNLNTAPSRAYAEPLAHGGPLEDGKDCIHERSRYRAASYSHPYTRELLPVEVPMELGILRIQALKDPFVEVFDVTVDKVNSYTTQGGLLNKNCWIGFDELTQYPTPFAFDYMRSRLRSTDPDLSLSVRATTNPGGPGHGWVKRMFIDPAPANTAFPAKNLETGEDMVYPETHEKAGQPLFYRRFIPASLYDNPYLTNDGAYEANLLAMPEMQRRQLLEGDWAIADGAAFPEFRPNTHVIEPFEIPDTWRRFRSCDYGYSSFSAVHWFAIDPAYETLVVYRELYVSKHTGKDLAKAVLEQERGERIDYGVLDSSCWHQRGQIGPSIAEEMIAMGCRWRPSDRTNGARVNGKNRFHEVLKVDEETGRPGIMFFNTCRQIIADLPVIPADPKGGDDINPKYASDHAYDSVRYGIMSRPRAFSPFDDGRGVPKQRWRPAVPAFGY